MPIRLRDYVVRLAAYAFIGCAHAMDVTKLTAGTPEAYIAISVLDDLTFLRMNTMTQQCFKHRPVLVWGKSKKGN
jgi:hypothetical protein